VFTRVQKDAVLLDLRTIREKEDALVVAALQEALKKG
jgi:hypothetical protein